VTNPFDDPDGTFVVLVNDEDQHSLWPVHISVPEGWRQTHPPASRDICLAHIAHTWTHLRPLRARTS
jgi:MbtH protein